MKRPSKKVAPMFLVILRYNLFLQMIFGKFEVFVLLALPIYEVKLTIFKKLPSCGYYEPLTKMSPTLQYYVAVYLAWITRFTLKLDNTQYSFIAPKSRGNPTYLYWNSQNLC